MALTSSELWVLIQSEAREAAGAEPLLSGYYQSSILAYDNFDEAISAYLATKLTGDGVSEELIKTLSLEALKADESISAAMRADIEAYVDRDPACDQYCMPFLYFKGFHALQAYRISHWLWQQQRHTVAQFFQNHISESLGVDIHPAATVGSGIMIDHATGVVVGETAMIGDNVSMLHAVTLGGSGCATGDRHPKIGNGVLISAGAKILGNIKVGDGAKIGAGSVVLEPVPPHTTVAGVPAKIVGRPATDAPALDMNHSVDN